MYFSNNTWNFYTKNFKERKDFKSHEKDEYMLREVTQVKYITCNPPIPLKHADIFNIFKWFEFHNVNSNNTRPILYNTIYK